MTHDNFDPTDPDSQRSGRGGLDRYLGPEARQGSHLPGEEIDGEVEEDAPEDNNLSHEELPADEAARRLEEMQQEIPGEDLPGNTGPVE